jgi:hypothetical protein
MTATNIPLLSLVQAQASISGEEDLTFSLAFGAPLTGITFTLSIFPPNTTGEIVAELSTATYATVPVQAGGTGGAVIAAGLLTDPNGNVWALPSSVTIPASGSIIVNATCETAGAIALANGVTLTIANPQGGWASAATTGIATGGGIVISGSLSNILTATCTALNNAGWAAGAYSMTLVATDGVLTQDIFANSTLTVGVAAPFSATVLSYGPAAPIVV